MQAEWEVGLAVWFFIFLFSSFYVLEWREVGKRIQQSSVQKTQLDKRPFWKCRISEQFPDEKFRAVLQGAEPRLAGRRAQCDRVLVQEGAEGVCMDGRVPVGIFVGPCGSVEKGIGALPEALLSMSGDVSESAVDLEHGVGASWGVSSRSQAVGRELRRQQADAPCRNYQRILLPDMVKGPSSCLDVCYSEMAKIFACVVGAWSPWTLLMSSKPSSTLAAGTGLPGAALDFGK